MREQKHDHPDDGGGAQEHKPERAAIAYARGVRTALGNNATAYAFSISITSSYCLLSGTRGSVSPMETMSFGVAGAIAFLDVGAAFGLSRIPGFMAWPLAAFGTVSVFLLVGGVDVIVAQIAARHTSFARSQ